MQPPFCANGTHVLGAHASCVAGALAGLDLETSGDLGRRRRARRAQPRTAMSTAGGGLKQVVAAIAGGGFAQVATAAIA